MSPIERLRHHACEIEPKPTGQEPYLPSLPGVHAVLFDVYGTLFVSGVGDISLSADRNDDEAIASSFAAVGHPLPFETQTGISARFRQAIQRHQGQARQAGADYPEVDIREVWADLAREAGIAACDTEALAIEYESRVNPVAPMPGCRAMLESLRERGWPLGIVSNAQCFTPLLFPAFLDADLAALGIPAENCRWSFAHRIAKPSTRLFDPLIDRFCEQYGLRPENILYLGNDRRNDIWPAARLGCRTCLYAGDARSLRWRHDDPDLQSVKPDAIVTSLTQFGELLEGQTGPKI